MAALLVGSVLLSGCGDDGDDPAPTTSTAPAVTPDRDGGTEVTTNPALQDLGPTIERFEAPSTVRCEGDGPARAFVRWSAPEAQLVRFMVDAESQGDAEPASGSTELELPCDGSVHVVVLAAVGADGRSSLASKAVLAEPADR